MRLRKKKFEFGRWGRDMNVGSLPFGFRGVPFKTPPAYESDSCARVCGKPLLFSTAFAPFNVGFSFSLTPPLPPKKAGIPRNLSAIRRMPLPQSSSARKAGRPGGQEGRAHMPSPLPGSRESTTTRRQETEIRRQT